MASPTYSIVVRSCLLCSHSEVLGIELQPFLLQQTALYEYFQLACEPFELQGSRTTAKVVPLPLSPVSDLQQKLESFRQSPLQGAG